MADDTIPNQARRLFGTFIEKAAVLLTLTPLLAQAQTDCCDNFYFACQNVSECQSHGFFALDGATLLGSPVRSAHASGAQLDVHRARIFRFRL
jgi:hypothetical protein